MELFKVTCVTCQANLSVRNESLIGQIVACPRCGSMVEVAQPRSPAAPAAAVAAATVTTPDPPVVPSFEMEEMPGVVGEAEAATETEAAAEIDAAALPAPDVAAMQAEVLRYKIITWGLSSFCIGAALIAGFVLTRAGTNDVSPTTTNSVASVEPNHLEQAASPTAGDSSEKISPVYTQQIADTKDDLDPLPIEVEPPENPPTQPAVEPAEPVTPVKPEIKSETVAADPEPEPAAPRVVRRFDPLDFDPENLTLETVDQPVTEEKDAAAAAEPVEEPVAVTKDVPSTLPLVRRGPADVQEIIRRDAEKQLALLFPAVKFQDLALVDCLRLFSQLSGVPISVAPEQLLMAGITAKQLVSLDAQDKSLGEMLSQVLEPLRLEYQTRGPQVIVVRRESEKVREINYPVDDLVADDNSEEELAGWIEQFVAPQSWQAKGGKGTLKTTAGSLQIRQPQRVQYQVLILLERLRLARGLPSKSRYPVKRLAGRPAPLALGERLSATTIFSFTEFTRLEEVFAHWQSELGVPLLVDWPALADAEVWPTTTVACAINNEPWTAALEKVLEPLGLGWRAATGGAIEITSAPQAQQELQLELFPFRPEIEINPAGFLAQLQASIQKESGETSGMFHYEPVGKALLSLQPATAQRAVFRELKQQGLLLVE